MSLSLAAFIFLNLLTSLGGALYRPGEWYDHLNKPSWQPPSWLFPPVWFTLYIMIAFAGWLVWRDAPSEAIFLPMLFYGIQLVLNAAWSFIFFGMKRMDLALIEIAVMWLAIVATMVTFWPINQTAFWLLVPYLLWVSFASFLNWTMWQLNPTNGNTKALAPGGRS